MGLKDVSVDEDLGLPNVGVQKDVVFHDVGSGEGDGNVEDIVREAEDVNVEDIVREAECINVEGEGVDFDDDMGNVVERG